MRFSEITRHLAEFRVGIAGAGGLGSNCAVSLARSGVGTLVISDFDIVKEQNLSRQFYFADQLGMVKTKALKANIERITSGTRIIIYQTKLNPDNITEIYAGCDVIVEAFDNSDMKEMLIETIQSKMPGTPLVIGSGVAGWGNNETIRCRKLDDWLYVCGDESTEASDDIPCMSPRVGIVANMQANVVIEILMEKR